MTGSFAAAVLSAICYGVGTALQAWGARRQRGGGLLGVLRQWPFLAGVLLDLGGFVAQLVVMYNTPQDAAAFDRYYFDNHVPIAKKIPGLRKYQVSHGAVATPAGPSAFHLIATLTFDNVAAVKAAFASAEGKAAAADVGTFATGGADMILYDTKEV